MEKVKTVLLTLLVVISLVQSYMLGYSPPRPDPVVQGSYVESVISGTPAELKDVVFPDQIILHYGEEGHTVLYPMMFLNHYRNIYDFLKQRNFGDLRKTNVNMNGMEWRNIQELYQGIEIRFREGIPLNVLKNLVRVSIEDPDEDHIQISRIWMYSDGVTDEVKIFFVSDSTDAVYEAVRADVSISDLEIRLRLGESLPRYQMSRSSYYLPSEALPMTRISVPYSLYTAEQLKRSLFVNPGITRSLNQRDGTQIITDSVKGLQLYNDTQWFAFTNPTSAPLDNRNDMRDNLLSAIQFVNQHGGWNYSFLFSNFSQIGATGPQSFIFRQYLEGFPVIDVRDEPIGYIKVVVQRGAVSSYERSMITPDMSQMTKEQVVLPGGEELEALVNDYATWWTLTRVFPGYQAEILDDQIIYHPKWIVELRDGTYDVLE